MKKIIALVLALAMVLTAVAAFAADTASITKDEGIEIIGLETGDTVNIYQVLQWNTNTGWGKTSAFSSLADASVATLIGTPGTYNASTGEIVGKVDGTLTPAIATEIKGIYDANSSMAATGSTQTASQLSDGYGVQFTNIPAGLYMALITSGSSIVSYNPVFVSCDYSRNDGETQALISDLSIANVGYAKKTTDFDVDKQVKDLEENDIDEWTTADKDEIVQFIVNTTIPSYHANEWDVNKISYAVKDTLNGLALVNDASHLPTVKVKTVGSTGAFADLDTENYELTATNGADTLNLTITPAYLKEITGPMSLELTYYAKVTDDAVTNVSSTDNTVVVEYSNNPSDQTKTGKKHDKTYQYKFALDAELFGDDTYHTSELVKIGLDGSGKEIYEKKEYSNKSEHSPLAGAKFGLYDSVEAATAAIGGDGNLEASDDMGRTLISDLDVGTYFFVETKAPDGYIRDTAIYKIEISATEKHVNVDDGDCTFTTDVLDTYTVKVSAIEGNTTTLLATSTYTMQYGPNNLPASTTTTYNLDTIKLKSSSKVTEENKDNHAEDNTTEIRNKKGTELPSTGGIGTTIFYILGGLLVIGAAVILVARRKAQD